jgi:hypothetical protein
MVMRETYQEWLDDNLRDLQDSFCSVNKDFDVYCRDEFEAEMDELRTKHDLLKR